MADIGSHLGDAVCCDSDNMLCMCIWNRERKQRKIERECHEQGRYILYKHRLTDISATLHCSPDMLPNCFCTIINDVHVDTMTWNIIRKNTAYAFLNEWPHLVDSTCVHIFYTIFNRASKTPYGTYLSLLLYLHVHCVLLLQNLRYTVLVPLSMVSCGLH